MLFICIFGLRKPSCRLYLYAMCCLQMSCALGRDHMVVGFIATYVISAYHH